MKDWHIHCYVTSNEVLGFQFEKQGHQGAVWFHFFLSLNFHYSTFITHNSSLNFSYPFGIITKFPSFNIFHTICGPIPVSRCNFFFFFFFSVPKLAEANIYIYIYIYIKERKTEPVKKKNQN